MAMLMVLCVWNPGDAYDLVQPVLSIEGMSQDEQRIYLDGLADGFQIVNAKLERQGQPPLYCMTDNAALLGRDLLEFATENLQGPQEDFTIAVSGLLGLIKRYPCSKDTHDSLPPASKPALK